jgi:DNA-binding transcriptional ArsR family regulator
MKRPKRTESASSATTTGPAVRAPDPLIEDLARLFRLLSDKSRLKIVLALIEKRKLNVTALTDLVGLPQPAVSHHLTLMRSARLVDFHRDGKHNYYFIASAGLRDLLSRFFSLTDGASLILDDFRLSFQLRNSD